jgi:hypothetical protein
MNRIGILHLPLALLVLALSGAGMLLLQRVRGRTQAARQQRQADLSLGHEILALKKVIEETQALNEEIRTLRETVADDLSRSPEWTEELRSLRLKQLQKVESWEAFRSGSIAVLPPLPWRKTPDDDLGPTPWAWDHSPEEGFQIQVELDDAKAAGILENLRDEEAPEWKARWASPR